jgi:DNA-binding response OmpR family regulator/predicted regulator of Ras-like GTPase activity (Roadblock/LC7/MglB family)
MEASGPKTVLIVDDEDLFLRTVADGFAAHADRVNVLTAPNGRVAKEILDRCDVDLVVTDLKMPEMDGFQLIAHMSRVRPDVPVIVMTAFGTPEIEERLQSTGVAQHLDKPLDFPQLSARVFEVLAASASGHLQGITLPTFLQMVQADRKTCTLRVRSKGKVGLLHFKNGELLDAEAGALTGDRAAEVIVCWDAPEIEILAGRAQRARRVQMGLAELLLEAFRLKDEQERNKKQARSARSARAASSGPRERGTSLADSVQKEAEIMAANDKLKELANIEGFAGVAVYTPTGEPLAVLAGDNQHLKEVGILANNVLLNAQKASIEMGTGRGQQVHVEAEKAHIFARCLNEGTDPLKSQPGKAHIHLVLVLKNDSSIGLAKMRVNSVIANLAEDFRM